MCCFINFSGVVGADKLVSTAAQSHLQCAFSRHKSSHLTVSFSGRGNIALAIEW